MLLPTVRKTPSNLNVESNPLLSRNAARDIWNGLSVPPTALEFLKFRGNDGKPNLPSPYKIVSVTHGSIAYLTCWWH